MSLGLRIGSSRSKLNISQTGLARALGVTRQYISALEHGNRTPSLPFLLKTAAKLGVSVDYLVTGRQEIICDPITAVKADESLNPQAKETIILLINELRKQR